MCRFETNDYAFRVLFLSRSKMRPPQRSPSFREPELPLPYSGYLYKKKNLFLLSDPLFTAGFLPFPLTQGRN